MMSSLQNEPSFLVRGRVKFSPLASGMMFLAVTVRMISPRYYSAGIVHILLPPGRDVQRNLVSGLFSLLDSFYLILGDYSIPARPCFFFSYGEVSDLPGK